MADFYVDPAPVTRHLRSRATSDLLVAAVVYFNVFDVLIEGPLGFDELSRQLQLKRRPAMVLLPALCAMGFLEYNRSGLLELTAQGRFLVSSSSPNLTGYVQLDRDEPGVLRMRDWLMHDGPADASTGLPYVKDEAADSPMDEPESARFFTMALAGRARYLSPLVARSLPSASHLLDIAGGTGYYTFEWLRLHPDASATIVDRPAVLRIARELMNGYEEADDLRRRTTFLEADMLTYAFPQTDLLLAASVFHDWPEDVCASLMKKCAASLRSGGQLWIHGAFLYDSLDGPLAVTDYSATLFLRTRGRAYSRQEYRQWFVEAGLTPTDESIDTLMDYSLISARRS